MMTGVIGRVMGAVWSLWTLLGSVVMLHDHTYGIKIPFKKNVHHGTIGHFISDAAVLKV